MKLYDVLLKVQYLEKHTIVAQSKQEAVELAKSRIIVDQYDVVKITYQIKKKKAA